MGDKFEKDTKMVENRAKLRKIMYGRFRLLSQTKYAFNI